MLALLLVAALVVSLIVFQTRRHPGTGGPSAGPTAAGSTAASAPPAGNSPSAAPSTAPGTTTATPSPTGCTVPAGWHMYSDPTGFKVPVPNGWRRHTDSYGNVVFSEPNGPRLLLIGQTRHPKGDPVADWKAQEASRRGGISGYQRVGGIHAVDYWKTCADWEWLQNEGSVRVHVRNRGFVTAHDQAYALRWDTRAEDWGRYLSDFDNIIAKGFVPARKD